MLKGFPGVRSDLRGGQIVLNGALTPQRFQALQSALKPYPDMVDLVQGDAVHMRRMVELDVQVVNFSKNALRNLGINWQQSILGPSAGLVGDFHSNGLYRLGDVTGGGGAGNALNGPGGALPGLPLSVSPFAGYLGLVTSLTSAITCAACSAGAEVGLRSACARRDPEANIHRGSRPGRAALVVWLTLGQLRLELLSSHGRSAALPTGLCTNSPGNLPKAGHCPDAGV